MHYFFRDNNLKLAQVPDSNTSGNSDSHNSCSEFKYFDRSLPLVSCRCEPARKVGALGIKRSEIYFWREVSILISNVKFLVKKLVYRI